MNRPVDINYSLFSSGNAYVDFLDVEQVEEMAQAHRRARQPPASSGQTRFGLTPPLYYNLADGIAANRRINDALRQAANASGDVWFGVVEPKFGEAAVSEIHRIAGLGAAGVVWSPRAQGLFASDRSMSAMCRAAADSGLLSMIHSAPFSVNESLDRIWNLATACEGAAIVVIGAFTSWENIQIARNARGGPGNVSYDTSGLGETWDLQGLIADIGADRLVFGSGGPRFSSEAMELIERSALEPPDRDAILSANAARLLGTRLRPEES
ncbi:MAG: amidohydrolase family protein [Novosphingobium sp.]|nr:amidohydrolase family protein [Novosphingobium sp.]